MHVGCSKNRVIEAFSMSLRMDKEKTYFDYLGLTKTTYTNNSFFYPLSRPKKFGLGSLTSILLWMRLFSLEIWPRNDWKMSIQIIKMWLTVVYFLIFLVYQFLVMLQTSFFDYFLWLVLSLFSIWYCLYIGWMQILSI